MIHDWLENGRGCASVVEALPMALFIMANLA